MSFIGHRLLIQLAQFSSEDFYLLFQKSAGTVMEFFKIRKFPAFYFCCLISQTKCPPLLMESQIQVVPSLLDLCLRHISLSKQPLREIPQAKLKQLLNLFIDNKKMNEEIFELFTATSDWYLHLDFKGSRAIGDHSLKRISGRTSSSSSK
jgi:hypothetical protein